MKLTLHEGYFVVNREGRRSTLQQTGCLRKLTTNAPRAICRHAMTPIPGAHELEAKEALRACRQHGAFLLCGIEDGEWRLRIWNGHGVPRVLKHRLLELWPAVIELLQKLGR